MASVALPQKKFFRARAHSNPLNDAHFPVPLCPDEVNWSPHFPHYFPPPTEAGTGTAKESEAQGAATTALALSPNSEGDPPQTAGETRDTGAGAADVADQAPGPLNPGASASTPDGGVDAGQQAKRQRLDGEKQGSGDGTPASSQHLVRFADVGCGFGGLLVKLAPMFPDTLMVGMELRDKVSAYVHERIVALRSKNPGQYQNISVIRTNAMKYLPNYFRKGQLTKIFFLFPDPHFKEKNHRRRIITTHLLAEYAYVLAEGGTLYAITDVEELGTWMESHLASHPLFEKLLSKEMEEDPVIPLLPNCSEEAQKVQRNKGCTFMAVYRRIKAL